MRVLITGGAGFIGSHIALRLIEKRYDVTVLDNLLEQIHGNNPEKTSPLYCSVKDKVRFVKGDVCDKALLEEALKDADYVIHLCARWDRHLRTSRNGLCLRHKWLLTLQRPHA